MIVKASPRSRGTDEAETEAEVLVRQKERDAGHRGVPRLHLSPFLRASSGPLLLRRSLSSEPEHKQIRAVGTPGDLHHIASPPTRPAKSRSLNLVPPRSSRQKENEIFLSESFGSREANGNETIILPTQTDTVTSVEVVNRPTEKRSASIDLKDSCVACSPPQCGEGFVAGRFRSRIRSHGDSSARAVDCPTVGTSTSGAVDASKRATPKDKTCGIHGLSSSRHKNELDARELLSAADATETEDKPKLVLSAAEAVREVDPALRMSQLATDFVLYPCDTANNSACNLSLLSAARVKPVRDDAKSACGVDTSTNEVTFETPSTQQEKSDSIFFSALSSLLRQWKSSINEGDGRSYNVTSGFLESGLPSDGKTGDECLTPDREECSNQSLQNLSDAILLSRLQELVSSDDERSRVDEPASIAVDKNGDEIDTLKSSTSTDLVLLELESGVEVTQDRPTQTHSLRSFLPTALSTAVPQQLEVNTNEKGNASVTDESTMVMHDRTATEGFVHQGSRCMKSMTLPTSRSKCTVDPSVGSEPTCSNLNSRSTDASSYVSKPGSQILLETYSSINDTTFTESLIDTHSNDAESSSIGSGSESEDRGESCSSATTIPTGSPRGNLASRRAAPTLPFPPRDLLSLNFSLSSDLSSYDFGSSATQTLFSDHTRESQNVLGIQTDSAPSSCLADQSISTVCKTPRITSTASEHIHAAKVRSLVAPRAFSRRRSVVVQSLENMKSGENSLLESFDQNYGNISFETNESAAVEVVRYNLSIGPISFNYYSRKGK